MSETHHRSRARPDEEPGIDAPASEADWGISPSAGARLDDEAGPDASPDAGAGPDDRAGLDDEAGPDDGAGPDAGVGLDDEAGPDDRASAGASRDDDSRAAGGARAGAGSGVRWVSQDPTAGPGAHDERPGRLGSDDRADQPDDDLLAAVASERDEYLDALRRLQADFENYKKRMVRQQTEHLERAAEDLVGKLLPVLDTADLAVAHDGGDAVLQLRAALADALAREGLERIEPAGEPFDPAVADAVAHEPGDGGPMTVSEVLRAGYRWKGRMLRPAMVKVTD